MGIYHPEAPQDSTPPTIEAYRDALVRLDQIWHQGFEVFTDDDRLAWNNFSDELKETSSLKNHQLVGALRSFVPGFVYVRPFGDNILSLEDAQIKFDLMSEEAPSYYDQSTIELYDNSGYTYHLAILRHSKDTPKFEPKFTGYKHTGEFRRLNIKMLSPEFRNKTQHGQGYLAILESRKIEVVSQQPVGQISEEDVMAADPSFSFVIFKDASISSLENRLPDVVVEQAMKHGVVEQEKKKIKLPRILEASGVLSRFSNNADTSILVASQFFLAGLQEYILQVRNPDLVIEAFQSVSNSRANELILKSKYENLIELARDLELIFTWSFNPDRYESGDPEDDDSIDTWLDD